MLLMSRYLIIFSHSNSLQLLLKQCPELRTPNTESIQWDFSLFASILKSVFPSFSFTDLFASLDDPLFTIQRPEAFSFIYRMYCYVAGDILPSSLLYKPWKNIQQQIQFLNMLMFIDVSAFTKTSTQIVYIMIDNSFIRQYLIFS